MEFDIKWDGAKELTNVLTQAVVHAPDQASKMIKNNTESMRGKAIRNAPKPSGSRYGSNPYATGFLKDNIEARFIGPLTGEVEALASYATYVNWGTRKMDAQPFMSDAFDEQVPELEQGLRNVVEGLFR